eukprot:Blabericola_migrator_1__2729@NODE_1777_length_3809_cov_41_646446_g799_i4_p3_GENE_NODE_1777_length_3809_cov_41_646446_g799_i4NODE_1777_length_3809_cov_41_646446_g799_i4_p3_ORF_typecomplete_len130_score10_79_NODE_1777_length_3809_cov_41_646446_g799_i416432032
MQFIDTEGQGHTWKASKSHCNPSHLTTTMLGSNRVKESWCKTCLESSRKQVLWPRHLRQMIKEPASQCFDNVGKEREQPSSVRFGTMGYVQDFNESGSCWLYPVSYADHPEALLFDHFLTPKTFKFLNK